MKNMNLIEEIQDLAEITHLIVMIELEPLSDRYVQILLDPETFKKVSDVVWKNMPDSPKGSKIVPVRGMEPVKIPDCDSCYSKELIVTMTK